MTYPDYLKCLLSPEKIRFTPDSTKKDVSIS